jgi:hypothetical protein
MQVLQRAVRSARTAWDGDPLPCNARGHGACANEIANVRVISSERILMKKHRLLLAVGAVATALAAPHAAAQSDRSDTYRTPTDNRWGHRADRGMPDYSDPYYYDGRRAWYPHARAHIGPDNAYHSPTDGRSGGAGIPAPNGVVPSTLPPMSSGEPPYPPSRTAGEYRERDRTATGPTRSDTTDPLRNPQRSATDGRSGGTGVPSSSSGAVPSTQPQEDVRDRRSDVTPSTSPTTVR